jgi:hypothetical protein
MWIYSKALYMCELNDGLLFKAQFAATQFTVMSDC